MFHPDVPYISCGGALAAMMAGVSSVLARLQEVLLGNRPGAITTSGVVSVVAIVCDSVVDQGAILVLAELADQLGFQS